MPATNVVESSRDTWACWWSAFMLDDSAATPLAFLIGEATENVAEHTPRAD